MSKTFELVFSTGNDAFEGEAGEAEVVRILRQAADALEGNTWNTSGPNRIRDINGARVGYWNWEK
jgi:hypothetical protein